jgi:hypothetical protein
MTHHSAKQIRLDALKQNIVNLKPEHITEEQLAQLTEIINIALVKHHQHTGAASLSDGFFETENQIKTLENNIASLQNSDLLINNEMRLIEMQQALKVAQHKLEELADLIKQNPAELAHFKNIQCADHLPAATQLYECAKLL